MNEFAVLPTTAMEATGFKVAIKSPVCEVETLDEARAICLNTGGGAIFRMREPKGNPDEAGGHQTYGEAISMKDLKWMCLVEVIIPGTLKEAVLLEN
jgi:hypothetical protein